MQQRSKKWKLLANLLTSHQCLVNQSAIVQCHKAFKLVRLLNFKPPLVSHQLAPTSPPYLCVYEGQGPILKERFHILGALDVFQLFICT